MAHLAKKQIYSLGTVRQNRLKEISNILPSEKEMMKKERGSHKELNTLYDSVELRTLKWFDNRCVTLLSSFSSTYPLGKCSRYDRRNKEIIEIPCPKMVTAFNKGIRGFDLMDALIALYRIQIRSKKY